MKPDIYIIGVGPYSIVIAELAESCGYQVKGYYHYNNERNNEVYFGKKLYPLLTSCLITILPA